eukprot:354837-Chlamydomonas_euryale.AAC.6
MKGHSAESDAPDHVKRSLADRGRTAWIGSAPVCVQQTYKAHGAWRMGHGAWVMAHGARYMTCDKWHTTHDARRIKAAAAGCVRAIGA